MGETQQKQTQQKKQQQKVVAM